MPMQYEKEPSRLPFWKEIITPQYFIVTLSGGAEQIVDIRPPQGETWLIFLNAFLVPVETFGSNDFIEITNKVGKQLLLMYFSDRSHAIVGFSAVITYDDYIKIRFYNSRIDLELTGYYNYSGFKI